MINEDKLFPIFCLILTLLKTRLVSNECWIYSQHLLFQENGVMPTSLHMTNTVFIDRAIIVQPFMNGDIPDELSGLGNYFISFPTEYHQISHRDDNY